RQQCIITEMMEPIAAIRCERYLLARLEVYEPLLLQFSNVVAQLGSDCSTNFARENRLVELAETREGLRVQALENKVVPFAEAVGPWRKDLKALGSNRQWSALSRQIIMLRNYVVEKAV